MGEQLRGNQDWMSHLPDELLDVSLWNLAIPGSHDSMSFCLDLSSSVVKSESRLLQVLDRLAPCWTRPCIFRWATTQEALEELATWLDAHPKEIIIVCCSHFSCLTLSDHTQLVDYIISLFGPKLCSSQDCPTLRSCWSKNQQIIVSYGNQDMVQHHPELWTEIPYWYADSTDPKKVIAYLEAQKRKGRPSGLYICGLNLTESIPFVFLHPFHNMRKITTKALAVLLGWVAEQRAGPEVGSVNIICCDFVGVSDFCDCVIGLNYKRVVLKEH
ncbi:PI-PLC X domain-containing protein 1 isoform X3 [Syngnathoides biaculeatus]|uniref:PI-PLC X domain-containing protein 1 isoform X3 n=1 Tax=Syngnathoides biaculeatus TaxID=300417 RepID=UPI002ADD8ABA|nr:PI-PLC X domain-containing protein 1 isoform X3 [Syngnathoides biaculeatus]